MADLFSCEEVGQVHFDEGDWRREKGISQRH